MHVMPKRSLSTVGFTLIEMSVVLAIIALVVAGGIITLTVSAQSAQYNATLATMQAIDDAMLKFRIANNRLPCPSNIVTASSVAGFGQEAWASGACDQSSNNFYADSQSYSGMTMVEGGVPFQSLGLSPSFAADGWGNKIRYVVVTALTTPDAFLQIPVNLSCTGIEVCDSTGSVLTGSGTSAQYSCSGYPRTTSAAYALISHGSNGHGAYTMQANSTILKNAGSTNQDELTNCHCSSTVQAQNYYPVYVQKLPVLTNGSPLNNFDDIVTFKERWQLRTPTDLPQSILYIPDGVSSGNDNSTGVQAFNTNGKFLCKLFSRIGYEWWDSYSNTQTIQPQTIKADASNNLWLIDSNGVRETAPNGEMTYFNVVHGYAGTSNMYFGALNLGTDTLTDIAFDSMGNIWITDYSSGNVVAYENYTTPIQAYITSTPANQAACLAYYASANANPVNNCNPITLSGPYPGFLAIDSNNNLWVTHAKSLGNGSRVIEEFTSTGGHIGPISTWATYNGYVSGATSCSGANGSTSYTTILPQITTDKSGNLWVADIISHGAIIEYNGSGQCMGILTLTTGTNSCDGCFGTSASFGPHGIAVDNNGLLWVSDGNNNRIQQIDFCSGCSSPTPSQIWIKTLGGNTSGTTSCTGCSPTAASCTCTLSHYNNNYFNYPWRLNFSPVTGR